MPATTGAGAVPDGWDVTISNQGTGALTIDPAGSDTLNGAATLVLARGRTVRVQRVASTAWITVADTKDETGGVAATGEVKNRTANYSLVDGDEGDTIRLTGATARTFTLPDIDGTDVELGWQAVIVNASTAVLTLDGNGADTVGGAATVAIPAGHALKVQAVTTSAWAIIADTRQGSGTTDSTARADAARALATANSKISRDDLPPFASIYSVPQGIDGSIFPSPFEIFFSERITRKVISRLVVTVGGQVAQIDATTPLSRIAGTAVDSGSLRFALATQALNNVRSNITANTNSIDFQVTFTFSDGTSYLHTIPFPVNNVVFAPPSPRVQTVTPTAAGVMLNYSNGSAVQLNMNRNVTLNLGGGVHGQSMLVQTVQDGTGSRTITLNSAIQRDGRAAPVLSTAARARDFLYFYRDATSWVYLGIIKAA